MLNVEAEQDGTLNQGELIWRQLSRTLRGVNSTPSISFSRFLKTVNELLGLFNDDTKAMLSKLRDLLEELNDSEIALAGGKYTTSNLKEIKDLIDQWFASVNTSLPEAFTVSATALAV